MGAGNQCFDYVRAFLAQGKTMLPRLLPAAL